MFIKDSTFNIIRNILSLINNKLIDHSIRVTFILIKMLRYEGRYTGLELRKILFAAAFHDIGAYKTEEIRDLMEFDTKHTISHSVYGYLFIKHLSYMQDYAEAVLYHHIHYKDRLNYDSAFIDHALRIHLADRVDILGLTVKDDEMLIRQLTDCSGDIFNPDDVELFIKADKEYHILDSIRNGTYEDEIREYYKMLNLSTEDIMKLIKMLVFTIDFRSEQTVTHTIQMAEFSMILAELMGFDKNMIQTIRCAALLHDIGKIKTPTSILEKAGKLTLPERSVMELHVVHTREIIKNAVLPEVLEIAARHHEKLDGKGYPQGLCDSDLTLPQRILAVADIASALLSKRSYKEKMSKNSVIKVLNNMADDYKIDASVVKVFIDNYDYIIDAAENNIKDVIDRYESLKYEYHRCVEKYKAIENKFPEKNSLFSQQL